jgi:hypothetical protein
MKGALQHFEVWSNRGSPIGVQPHELTREISAPHNGTRMCVPVHTHNYGHMQPIGLRDFYSESNTTFEPAISK